MAGGDVLSRARAIHGTINLDRVCGTAVDVLRCDLPFDRAQGAGCRVAGFPGARDARACVCSMRRPMSLRSPGTGERSSGGRVGPPGCRGGRPSATATLNTPVRRCRSLDAVSRLSFHSDASTAVHSARHDFVGSACGSALPVWAALCSPGPPGTIPVARRTGDRQRRCRERAPMTRGPWRHWEDESLDAVTLRGPPPDVAREPVENHLPKGRFELKGRGTGAARPRARPVSCGGGSARDQGRALAADRRRGRPLRPQPASGPPARLRGTCFHRLARRRLCRGKDGSGGETGKARRRPVLAALAMIQTYWRRPPGRAGAAAGEGTPPPHVPARPKPGHGRVPSPCQPDVTATAAMRRDLPGGPRRRGCVKTGFQRFLAATQPFRRRVPVVLAVAIGCLAGCDRRQPRQRGRHAPRRGRRRGTAVGPGHRFRMHQNARGSRRDRGRIAAGGTARTSPPTTSID